MITEQRHNKLNIIHRFIRTLRDRIRKNKSISSSDIHKSLKTYKVTIHQTTGASSAQIRRIRISNYNASLNQEISFLECKSVE
jgi:uncharacterized protein YerC